MIWVAGDKMQEGAAHNSCRMICTLAGRLARMTWPFRG